MDDGGDLIQRLCTKAGMMMEDAIPIALAARAGLPDGGASAVSDLRKRVERIDALINAAKALTDKI